MRDRYLVLSSSSLGYSLLSEDGKDVRLSRKRGKVSYREMAIVTGDVVTLDGQGFIEAVLPRLSFLPRPRLANAEEILVICSLKKPDLSFYLLDKFLALVNHSGIHAGIVVTKADLASETEREACRKALAYYEGLGYPVFLLSALERESLDFPSLIDYLAGKKVAFMGQTGVGKSTLLNTIDPTLKRKVDALYPEVNRGRHTTKETVLIPFGTSLLYDTPGFSDFRLMDMNEVELATFFPGFENLSRDCLFKDCLHLPSSKGCGIVKAVSEGRLPEEGYRDYLKINEEVKEESRWKKKKG